MTELISAIHSYGWAVVLIGVGVYLLLHGELSFRYPRK
jgi:hypothetical protein